jgi:hypothetical protein
MNGFGPMTCLSSLLMHQLFLNHASMWWWTLIVEPIYLISSCHWSFHFSVLCFLSVSIDTMVCCLWLIKYHDISTVSWMVLLRSWNLYSCLSCVAIQLLFASYCL